MSVDVSYFAYNSKRADEGWSHFAEDLPVIKQARKDHLSRDEESKLLNNRQLKIYCNTDLSFLDGTQSKNDLLSDLFRADLFLGSIQDELPFRGFDYNPVEEVYGIGYWGDGPGFITDISEWVKIYEGLSPKNIDEKTREIMEMMDWPWDGSDGLIREFFLGMKPLIKECKDNPESFLVKETNGEIEPSEIEVLIKKRVEQKYKEYKLILEQN